MDKQIPALLFGWDYEFIRAVLEGNVDCTMDLDQNVSYVESQSFTPDEYKRLYEQVIAIEAMAMLVVLAKSYNDLARAYVNLAIHTPLELQSKSTLQAMVEALPHLGTSCANFKDLSAERCIELLRQLQGPLDEGFRGLNPLDVETNRYYHAIREVQLNQLGLVYE
jgi:hypothetical protein